MLVTFAYMDPVAKALMWVDKHPTHTPWKINIEPENHWVVEEKVFQRSIFRFHVNLPECV